MLTVATLLWSPNRHSKSFSSMYDETWVTRLLNGFARNLTVEFRFKLFVDRIRDLPPCVEQIVMDGELSYADCIRPFALNEPMILVGLDTIVTGNIDHLAEYCLTADVMALPRDPYHRSRSCNGVCLVPAGQAHVYTEWRGENDMEWLRGQPHVFIDDIWPGHVQSYKGDVKGKGLGDTRICYFHGNSKPPELQHVPWVREHWR